MNVIELVRKELEELRRDGLFNVHGECGCLLDNLAPCGEISGECEIGYKVPCDCEGTPCNFHVRATKPTPT